MSVSAQLVFTWSIPHADDLGILPRSHKTLKATIVPILEISIDDFGKVVDEIIKQGLWQEYIYKDEKFYRIMRFGEHQTLKKDRKPNTYLKGVEDWKQVEELGFHLEDRRHEISGENHPNWKGGITPEITRIRNSPEMAKWRLNVFERDDFTCQKCGLRGIELEAHHIKPFATFPDLRFEVSNGATVCKECHYEVNGTDWKPSSSLREVKGSKEKIRKENKVSPNGELTPKERTILFFEAVDKQNDAFHSFVHQLAQQNTVPPESIRRELKKFADYWTELNGSGTKMRWQMEKVFDVRRRLATWFGRVGFKNFTAAAPSGKGKNIIL